MLDLVAVAMVAIIPMLGWSIYLVRSRKKFRWHKRLQMSMGGVLLVALTLFELEMQIVGWKDRAAESRYYESWLFPLLYVHIAIAVTTAGLWIYTIVMALMHFGDPPRPGDHSRHHRRVARCAGLGMGGTAVSGWLFYYMAFVA